MPACESCGAPLKPEEEASGMCFACRMARLQDKVEPRQGPAAAPPKAGLPWGIILRTLSAAVLVAVLFRMLPGLISSLAPEKPLSAGSIAMDSGGQACVTNLWRAAAAIQEGRETGTLRCPVSGKPYQLREGRIYCPTPERHGLTELSSSETNPLPRSLKY